MLAAYRALAAETADGMRQWWQRTGWVWAGVLLVVTACGLIDNARMLPHHAWLTALPNSLQSSLNWLAGLGTPAAAVLWLLAALHALTLAARTSPARQSPAANAPLFLLAVAKGLWPALGLGLHSLVITCSFVWAQSSAGPGQSMNDAYVQLTWLQVLTDAESLAAGMLWCLAIAVLIRPATRLAWGLAIALFLAEESMRTLFMLLQMTGLTWSNAHYTVVRPASWQFALYWLLGLLLALGLIESLRRRRPLAAALPYVLLVMAAAAHTLQAVVKALPAMGSFGEYAFYVLTELSRLNWIFVDLPWLGFLHEDQGRVLGTLSLLNLDHVTVQGSAVWGYLGTLLNVLWLAGLTAALARLVAVATPDQAPVPDAPAG